MIQKQGFFTTFMRCTSGVVNWATLKARRFTVINWEIIQRKKHTHEVITNSKRQREETQHLIKRSLSKRWAMIPQSSRRKHWSRSSDEHKVTRPMRILGHGITRKQRYSMGQNILFSLTIVSNRNVLNQIRIYSLDT